MFVWTTCRLIVASRGAWQTLALEQDELPSPAVHPAAVGGVSALFAALVSSFHPGSDLAYVVRHTLAAISSCVGAAAAAVWLVPNLFSSTEAQRDLLARYASVSSLPLAAGGIASVLPHVLLSMLAIAALGCIAYRSGSFGAAVFLNLEGDKGTRIAAATALISTLPGLLTLPLCAVR